ncbi:MAG: hypothetical protein R2710_02585 [Acidimicrobiales bacterium]
MLELTGQIEGIVARLVGHDDRRVRPTARRPSETAAEVDELRSHAGGDRGMTREVSQSRENSASPGPTRPNTATPTSAIADNECADRHAACVQGSAVDGGFEEPWGWFDLGQRAQEASNLVLPLFLFEFGEGVFGHRAAFMPPSPLATGRDHGESAT